MTQSWYDIIAGDAKYLEEISELTNVCMVKKVNHDKKVVPSHIVFNFWFDDNSISLKAMPIPEKEGYYNIQFKDIIIIKETRLCDIVNTLNKYEIEVTRDYSGNINNIRFSKRHKKKGKKNKCLDIDDI